MKKCLMGWLLAAIMLLSAIPTTAWAESVPQLAAGESKTYQWTSDTDEYYLQLTVPKSGYYNVTLNERLHKGALSALIFDDSNEADTWYSIDTHGTNPYQFSNIYLKSGRTYAVRMACYDSNYELCAAKVTIQVKKTDHTPTLLSASFKSYTLHNNEFNLFRIRTDSAGDYLLSASKSLSHLYIYDSSHRFLCYKDCSSKDDCMLTLDGSTTYYVEIIPDYVIGDSGLSVKLSVAKMAKDITKIAVYSQLRTILADEIYFDKESLSSSLFDYKITYSDGSTAIMTNDDLIDLGIFPYIYYAGTLQTLSDDTRIANTGKQYVTVSYLNDRTTKSKIYISSFWDYFSYLTPIAENDQCYITTENGQTDTYYWHLNMDSCGVYKNYSDPNFTKALNSWTMKVFDEDNNEVPYDSSNGGWWLAGKHDYIFQLQYDFKSSYVGEVNFWFASDKVTHHYTKKVVAPTYTAKGYTKRTCTGCGYSYKSSYTDMKALAQAKISSIVNAKDGITVKWGKVTGATAYQVWRKAGSGDWKLLKTTTSTSLTNTKLTNGAKYQYKVRAIAKNSSGKIVNRGAYSTIRTKYRLSAPTLDIGTKNIATRKIVVKWDGNPKATGYQVKYVVDTTAKTVKVTGADTLRTTLSKLTMGKTYKVYVRSYKTVGSYTYYSAYSAYKSVKIDK